MHKSLRSAHRHEQSEILNLKVLFSVFLCILCAKFPRISEIGHNAPIEALKRLLFYVECNGAKQKFQFHLGDANIARSRHAIHLLERTESPFHCAAHGADQPVALFLSTIERTVAYSLVHDAVFEQPRGYALV